MNFVAECSIFAKAVWNLEPTTPNVQHFVKVTLPDVPTVHPFEIPAMMLRHQGWGIDINDVPSRQMADKVVRMELVHVQKGAEQESEDEQPRQRMPENGIGLIVAALVRISERRTLKLSRPSVLVPEVIMYSVRT